MCHKEDTDFDSEQSENSKNDVDVEKVNLITFIFMTTLKIRKNLGVLTWW